MTSLPALPSGQRLLSGDVRPTDVSVRHACIDLARPDVFWTAVIGQLNQQHECVTVEVFHRSIISCMALSMGGWNDQGARPE
jgi:hypothetical protein